MHGDSARAAKAREMIAERDRRYQFFPAALFDEHPWDMLLHLFVALFQNEVMIEQTLVNLVHASPEVGRRWLGYLLKAGHLEARNDGDGVVLTEATVDRMRAYLGPVEQAVTAT